MAFILTINTAQNGVIIPKCDLKLTLFGTSVNKIASIPHAGLNSSMNVSQFSIVRGPTSQPVQTSGEAF